MSPYPTLFLALFSSVSALLVPRQDPPNGWDTANLEPYNAFHERYLAIGCQNQHHTSFFHLCCHPLLATEKLEDARPPQCIPCSADSPPPVPSSTDDGDDCDDEDDGTPSLSDPSPAVPPPTETTHDDDSPHPTLTTHANIPNIIPKPKEPPSSPTPTSTQEPAYSPEPQSKPQSNGSSASGVNTGGFATYYLQNGVAGACGKVNDDNAMIAAIDGHRYGNLGAHSSLCGKRVHITNTKNNKAC
jgi:hypothetical protein